MPHGLPRISLQDWLLYSGAVPRHDRKGWIQTQNVLRRDATGLIDFTAVINPPWVSRVCPDASYYHFLRNVRAGQDNVFRRRVVVRNHRMCVWVLGTHAH